MHGRKRRPRPAGEPIAFDESLDMIAPKPPIPKVRRRSRHTREELDAMFAPKREGYGY